MSREFRHALTGRSIRVREGSRTERLVEADKNWTEVKPESSQKTEPMSGGSRGAGNSGRRGRSARKGSDDGGDVEG